MALKSKKISEEKVEIPDTSEIKPLPAKDEQDKKAEAHNLETEPSDASDELPVSSSLPKEPVLDVQESDEEEKEEDKLEESDCEDKEEMKEEEEEAKLEESDSEEEEELEKMMEADSEEEKKEEEKELEEHIGALTRGKALSEAFKKETATIFSAAVKSSVDKKKKKLAEAYNLKLKEQKAASEKKLARKLSDYLDLVVEEYLKENKLPIENAIKAELTESFMCDLKSVFEKHNIDLPESKVDLVEEQSDKILRLEKELNESLNKQIELKKTLAAKQKEEILSSVCNGLVDTEAAKLRKLAESLKFDSSDEFHVAVKTLKESYFPAVTPKVNDLNESILDNGGLEKPAPSGGLMDLYTRALKNV